MFISVAVLDIVVLNLQVAEQSSINGEVLKLIVTYLAVEHLLLGVTLESCFRVDRVIFLQIVISDFFHVAERVDVEGFSIFNGGFAIRKENI